MLSSLTYGGLLQNPHSNKAYFCYIVYDAERGIFYSGSHGVYGRDTADIGEDYFTSSTIVDFVRRFSGSKTGFYCFYEYFLTRKEAFEAEHKFHMLHDVARSRLFYNSQNCGELQNCGAGSTLCIDGDGNTYRVSSEEYLKGNHVHCCAGRMLVRLKNSPDVRISIKKHMFDPDIHITQFSGFVLCYDKLLDRNVRIPGEVFYDHLNTRYIGITSGMVMAKDIRNGGILQVSKEDFDSNDNFVGLTQNRLPVIDKKTGERLIIDRSDFDRNKYEHHNNGLTVQFSLLEKRNVSIPKEAYRRNKHLYANMMTKCFIVYGGYLFRSLNDFREYARECLNKCVRSEMSHARRVIPNLVTITKDDFIKNGIEYAIYSKN